MSEEKYSGSIEFEHIMKPMKIKRTENHFNFFIFLFFFFFTHLVSAFSFKVILNQNKIHIYFQHLIDRVIIIRYNKWQSSDACHWRFFLWHVYASWNYFSNQQYLLHLIMNEISNPMISHHYRINFHLSLIKSN
jgi:hypothetical protein